MDVSVALLSLLEMTVNYELVCDSFTRKILLSPSADLCRSAHRALCQIARSRAASFITTVGKLSQIQVFRIGILKITIKSQSQSLGDGE